MIDILVPLGRPWHVKKIIANIRSATQVEHTILFICSTEELQGIAAVVEAGLEPLIGAYPARGAYACKINGGYRATSHPWFLCGADDLHFHTRWDIEAIAVGEQTGAGVIGTNDLGNPSVMSGQHSTHPLIRRSYIDERGGTFDREPGLVLFEGYGHQNCDTELVALAKARKTFEFAPESHVEHLHPFWKKSDMDAMYQKGQASSREDWRMYHKRLRMMRKIDP